MSSRSKRSDSLRVCQHAACFDSRNWEMVCLRIRYILEVAIKSVHGNPISDSFRRKCVPWAHGGDLIFFVVCR